jgi:hypothetical protein
MNKIKQIVSKYLSALGLDGLHVGGHFELECRDIHGNLKWKESYLPNGVTNAGFAQLALLAGDASAVPFTYLAVGTSSTVFAASQTALVAEITDTGLARAAATVSRVTTTQTNDTLQLVYTWTATGTKAIEEVGIFNAASTGTMLARALTTTKTVNNGESLVATYKVRMS